MVRTIAKIKHTYVSCACNRTAHAADWGYNGLICYGACNAVAIYDPKAGGGGKLLTTLTGHKGRVNSVKWVRKGDLTPELELVSVASDHCGLLWTKSDGNYTVSDVLKGHESSVTVVDAVYRQFSGSELTLVVVTASVDSTIRIWERQLHEAAVCLHVVSLDSGVCLSVSLTIPNSSGLLLACGWDDCNVHLYSEVCGELVRQQVLKGHEDWVTSLEFTTEEGGDLLLASGAQDCTVRLWRFRPPGLPEASALHLEERTLSLGTRSLVVSLESVLLGHEGRVYGVRWHPPVSTDGKRRQPLVLLTASLDKTVVLWTPEADSGVWLEAARMGEVGGNTLGFYGASFGPSGSAVLAHSFQGGFHIWHKHEDGWRPGVVVGGHFDAVTDLGWEPRHGRYVVSVSSDQTTRLHAPWVREKDHSWHEIARPQVHGYDLVCLAMLPDFRFVSGADEKVVRAFTAPQNFLENFKRLCLKKLKEDGDIDQNMSLPTGAAVPVLGLSNKAVYQNEVESPPENRHVKDQYDDNSYFTPQHLLEPPTEDNLLQNTLWPETTKLYGHGYEVFSVATTADGSLLASACKATNEEHAVVLLWDTFTWQRVGRLVSHQLTITQMQFSPEDLFLLTVSRDRRWSVFQRNDSSDSDAGRYRLVGRTDKSTGIHSRIIWCCAWSPDSAYFATGSRDGKLVVWGRSGEDHPTLGPFAARSEFLELPQESITAVAFGPRGVFSAEEYLLGVGSEAGDIRLYSWSPTGKAPWRFLSQLSGNSAHHLAVKRLSFRPIIGKAGQENGENPVDKPSPTTVVQLASCGLDHTLRICDVYVQ